MPCAVSDRVLKLLSIAIALGCCLCWPQRGAPQDVTASAVPEAVKQSAQDFVKRLAAGEFPQATQSFDAAMLKVLPAEKLEQTWKSVEQAAGPFQKQTTVRFERKDKYDIVYVTCVFRKTSLEAKVVFNHDQKITGLFFVPAGSNLADYKPPAYSHRDAFREVDVKVGTDEWVLPGTLSIPNGTGPFPAVILVHGSGAHDRDETIGPNRPFRDIAGGLASSSIAVLRYEKRTKEHARKLVESKDTLTIKEEVLDDAAAAVATLRGRDEIDDKKIFVLGHSLGAYAAPKIATLDHHIAGLICMAGNTRPIDEVIIDQITYIASLEPNADAKDKARFEKIKTEAAKLRDPNLTKETAAQEKLLGAPLAYWQSVRACDPRPLASRLTQPVLILQGERDYQVTMEDFAGWKKALAGKTNATFTSYPKLNHLFMEGEGKAKPGEYDKAGHVAGQVIDDIAALVKQQ